MSKKRRKNEYKILYSHVELHLYSNTYGNFIALIDKEDYEKVSQYNWSLTKALNTDHLYYIQCRQVGRLHRYIMDVQDDKIVDHIDGNTMNNRRSNLRVCTKYENARNRKRSKKNKTGYGGVWAIENKDGKLRWKACISICNKTINLGTYDSIEEAIEARKEFEDKFYKNYCRKDIDYNLIESNKI